MDIFFGNGNDIFLFIKRKGHFSKGKAMLSKEQGNFFSKEKLLFLKENAIFSKEKAIFIKKIPFLVSEMSGNSHGKVGEKAKFGIGTDRRQQCIDRFRYLFVITRNYQSSIFFMTIQS